MHLFNVLHSSFPPVTKSGAWLLTDKEANFAKRNVWFISEAGKARCLRLGTVGAASGIHIQRQAFISGGRGPHVEAAQTALAVILKWGISGL